MQVPTDNPLLDVPLEIPFDRIRATHVVPAIEQLLADARTRVRAIADAPPTYAATLGALEAATERLEVALTVVGHLESVKNHPELREAYQRVRPEADAFYASIPLDAGLYRALRRFADTPEARALGPTRRRLLDRTLDEFKRHGAELDDAGKARLEAMSREMAELTLKFSENVLDSTAAWELVLPDATRLAGLPPSALEAAAASAAAKGATGYRLTLQAPSVIAVLTYADDATLREEIWRAFNGRASSGTHDNRPIITKILDLRREKAALLGFSTFADLVLADRMAKDGRAARAFVDDLTLRTEAAFHAENAALLAFRRQTEGRSEVTMAPWDVGYWSEKLRKAEYDFDEEELRPYFALDRVMDGLFSLVERLYGVRVRPRPELTTWAPEVQAYGIEDADGTRLGTFYADWFPRDEKRQGAWMNGLVTGVLEGSQLAPHVGVICGNFTRPIGDRPALLTHAEVETTFHEFGHLMHHMLSRVEVRSLAGTNVAWDFVELPSQIMENWCWEREALDLFARHVDTGAPIPEPLFQKLVATRTFRAANAQMRQLGFATTDLELHTAYDPARDGDVVAHARRLMQRFAPATLPETYGFLNSFSHLFSSEVGYAAGYYSYKWAEVLDADAFTRFKREGVFSRDAGQAFRRELLERGNADDPMALYERFMGRKPDLSALLTRSGLRPTA
jgi:oligopeptidase A